MAYSRYLIEIGTGVDMHGQDNTNAALKALKDATHHCCMAGIHDIFGFPADREHIRVKADLYAPDPEKIDPAPLEDYLGAYETELQFHAGGASAPGLSLPQMGSGDHITVVVAVLTVYLRVDTQRIK